MATKKKAGKRPASKRPSPQKKKSPARAKAGGFVAKVVRRARKIGRAIGGDPTDD